MSTLTEFRKPKPKYGQVRTGWAPKTPWEIVDKRWQRLYQHRRPGCYSHYRRAEIARKDGGWAWRVIEWRGAEGVRREIQRGTEIKLCAQAAMPFAELAAWSV